MNSADTTSGSELDKSGNNLNLSIANSSNVAGRVQEAMSFNGSSSALNVYAPKLDLTASLTLSVWIKTSNSSRAESIISKYDTAGTEAGYLLKTNANGTMSLRVGGHNTTNGAHEVADPTKINDGQWHHVAVVVNLGQSVTFFVNGVQTSSVPFPSIAASSSVTFEVGNIAYAFYAQPFTGAIDEVKVFNSALTPSQIASLAAGN